MAFAIMMLLVKRHRANDDDTESISISSTFQPFINKNVDIELSEEGGLQLESIHDTSLATALLSDMPLVYSLVQAWRASDMQVTNTKIKSSFASHFRTAHTLTYEPCR